MGWIVLSVVVLVLVGAIYELFLAPEDDGDDDSVYWSA